MNARYLNLSAPIDSEMVVDMELAQSGAQHAVVVGSRRSTD